MFVPENVYHESRHDVISIEMAERLSMPIKYI